MDAAFVADLIKLMHSVAATVSGVAGLYFLLIAVFSFLSLWHGRVGRRAFKVLELLMRRRPKSGSD